MINSSIFRTQEGEGITSCTKVIVGMIKKVLLVFILLSVSSIACKIYAFEYPKFKCYTDRENEYLLGNVKKVVLSTDNDIVCEYNFNQQGNYSSISINKYTSSEYPFQKKYYRYFCEGCFVNNYFYNFFNVGLIYDDYHVPFWLGYLGARRNLTFSYDYNGKLTKIVTKEFGGGSDEYKFDYDNNGNPITRYCNGLPIMKFQWIGNNMSGFHIYNNEGRGIEEYNINCNNLTYKIINLRHKSQEAKIYLNNKGTVEKYEKFYDDSQTTVSCVYNSKGLLEKITNELKNRNEVTLITTSFVYDSYNNVLEHKEVKKTRHPSQTQWRTPSTEYIKYAYSYDKVGNWIKKVTYSVKQGDIEVKEKIATETRQITYYEGLSASQSSSHNSKYSANNTKNISTDSNNNVSREECWYVFGSQKELQGQKILIGNSVNTKSLNSDYFTKIYSNERKKIKLYSKIAEVISSHPSNSYNLGVDNNGDYQLTITDPQSFWSMSKYLVIVNSK